MSDGLGEYTGWLNDLLFQEKFEDGETIHWLGGSEWLLLAPDTQEAFIIELKRAKIEGK